MSRQSRYVVVLACLTILPAAGGLHAQQARKPQRQTEVTATAIGTAGFSAAERRIIADYFARHHYATRPLPPGIAKNLARGKPLPPGIARQRAPADLVRQLSRRDGFEVSIIGDRIVLHASGGLIVDVLDRVLR